MDGNGKNIQALEDFRLDIQCLAPLQERSKKFNLFDLLKISKTEIRHSNMLAWLLDPSGNHELGDAVLRRFLQELLQQEQSPLTLGKKSDPLRMDLSDVVLLREYKYTDILAISPKKQFLVCIENKIFSKEGSGQLHRYHTELKEAYPSYCSLFVYLTPNKNLPNDEEDQAVWQTLGYDEIIRIINTAKEGKTLAPDVEMVIRHYIESVERYVMGDRELEKQCKEIYRKHKAALDLIFEYRDDNARQVSEYIKAWCIGKTGLIFNEDMASKGEIPFTTEAMNRELPPFSESISYWNDKNMYRYAFINRNNGQDLCLKLFVNRQNLSEAQLTRCAALARKLRRKEKPGWTWWTLKNWPIDVPKMNPAEEEYQEKLFTELDKAFKKLTEMEKELKESSPAE